MHKQISQINHSLWYIKHIITNLFTLRTSQKYHLGYFFFKNYSCQKELEAKC
jgi:hypothetical protein